MDNDRCASIKSTSNTHKRVVVLTDIYRQKNVSIISSKGAYLLLEIVVMDVVDGVDGNLNSGGNCWQR